MGYMGVCRALCIEVMNWLICNGYVAGALLVECYLLILN